MKNRDGSEPNDNWETPKYLYDKLNEELNFDFDPCPLNAEFDGLEMEGGKSNFINSPYSKFLIPIFIQQAFEECKKGKPCKRSRNSYL